MSENIIVKLVYRATQADEKSPFNAQIKNGKTWGKYTFTFNPLVEDYDWLAVIDDIPRILPNKTELLKCPRENTILITTEPSSITRYGRAFAGQFAYLITNQEESVLPHPNAFRSQTGNVWFYGKSYDEIKNIPSISKNKKISTVCSSKQQGHTMHMKRFEFTRILEEKISQIERFGHGVKWIDSKADALDDYEFHVAIENHIGKDVWTEKLADSFLAFCVPIYCGCPNVYDYFPQDSLIVIDIDDIDGSIEKIKKIIATPGEYQRRFEAVKEARRRVLEEYNLPAMIANIVDNAPKSKFTPRIKIHSRRAMRVIYPPDLFRYFGFRIKNFLKEMFKQL